MPAVSAALILVLTAVAPQGLGLDELAELAQTVAAVAPTPQGDGHLGTIESGQTVQVRFPLPARMPLLFAVNLGNVVAYTGRGTSYQLVLRRDAADGEVVYTGPVEANGDRWNALNREPIDLTAALTPADLARGWVDLYLTGRVENDGWTLYRDNPGRPISARVAERTPEIDAALATAQALRERKISLIPAPQRLELQEGELRLKDGAAVVLAAGSNDEDRFAAGDLSEVVRDRSKLQLALRNGEPRQGDITLRRLAEPLDGGPDAYRVVVEPGGARGEAATASGLFYAACTLAQLVRADGSLPCCAIDDWPDYPLRGLQYDVARGQTVSVAWWERMIRDLARCKLNAIMIYGENDYRFEAYPFLGREGTFTPEKAKHLSEYAHRYHLELIPQFEALGHASAVLRSEPLAPLREAGQAWVFCTSATETWTFLDRVFGELEEQFPYSHYLHVGADEFEGSFGLCDRCRDKVARDGVGGLYAEHMNHLAELCLKHGRTMLFWPSHGGPTPELSWMTQQYADQLDKRCIPTEWIYHGPSAYPTLEEYQKLGFKDVWASAAVVCFGGIWPDYTTSFRGIRGFLRAGHERGIGGAMTTTWEWMQGALAANSMLGLAYSAECAWSLGRTPVSDFCRRYGGWMHGADDPRGDLVRAALVEPWPAATEPGGWLRDRKLSTDLAWTEPMRVCTTIGLKQPRLVAEAEPAVAALEAAVGQVDRLEQASSRNQDLLGYARLGLGLLRSGAHRLELLTAAAREYRAACDQAPADGAATVRRLAGTLVPLEDELHDLAVGFAEAAEETGAYRGDADRLATLAEQQHALRAKLEGLGDDLAAGRLAELPSGGEVGLRTGRAVLLGRWEPKQMSEQGLELRFPVDPKQVAGGHLDIELAYTRGAHGMTLKGVKLLRTGEAVAEDAHQGWTGAGTRDNVYTLAVETVDPAAKYEVVCDVASSGGTDSYGEVWLVVDE